MAVNIFLPCPMTGKAQLCGGFRGEGNNGAVHIDTPVGQLPHQPGRFLPGFKFTDLAGGQLPEQPMAHPLILHSPRPGGDVADMGIVAFGGLAVIGVPVPLLIHQDRHGRLLSPPGSLFSSPRHRPRREGRPRSFGWHRPAPFSGPPPRFSQKRNSGLCRSGQR